MKQTSLLIFSTFVAVACGKGAGPEPKTAEEKPAALPSDAAKADATDPKESGRRLEYTATFADATATLSICTDGPFARVDETWAPAKGSDKKRWGADRSRMIFDSANRTLTVVNLSKNTFVKIDETRIGKAKDDLEKGTPMALGNLGAARGALDTDIEEKLSAPLVIPVPEPSPKKKHPKSCAVFARNLPQGLREEGCFAAFDEELAASEAFSPLLSLNGFTQGLEARVREMEIVAAVSEGIEWDLGLPAALYKFGDSPFEEDLVAMESWDRTLTLTARGTCTVAPSDLDPPKEAAEEFGLLPWPTPFIVTALPK